jgi:hypothetical protein
MLLCAVLAECSPSGVNLGQEVVVAEGPSGLLRSRYQKP